MFDIELELKKLPRKPGVYIMRDKDNNILYVGKAVILKNRVRQYFRKNNKTLRIEKMVSLIDHFEYIVTDNEAEALILECNLIKENRPRFNVLLKDDKTYPYIRIDIKSDYPNIIITRTIKNDGAKYFGPYANSGAAKEMLDFIKQRFQIRQCRNFKSNQRACLNYHIKRCLAPCIGNVSKEDYKKLINQAIMLLEGKTENVIKKIDEEINELSKKLEYENAAILRDKKLAIQAMAQKQKVSNITENEIDVIGIAKNKIAVCVEVFFVRNSKMIGREHYFLNDLADMQTDEILAGFIKQYYMNKQFIPNKIMISEQLEEKEIIEEWLREKSNHSVELKHPQKGEKLRFVEMAERNAQITLNNREQEKVDIVLELQRIIGTEKLPRKIETFDISNISGSFMVAGMCVAEDGVIKRNLSRRFKIKTVLEQNDPKCMEEVVERRLKHSQNGKVGFGTLPDLILADRGITQIKAIKEAIKKCNLDIPVYGMVKDDKHKTRALLDENRKELPISEDIFLFLSKLQDEVHKTAIEYHRKLREKSITKSELDEISGIGEKKKQELLKKFGSVEKIKKASIEELTNVKGINVSLANKIKKC